MGQFHRYLSLGLLLSSAAVLLSPVQPVYSQSANYCLEHAYELDEVTEPNLSAIYLNEAEGAIASVCIQVPGALLSVADTGELTLLRREADVDVDYYQSGVRDDLIREIGRVDIDYYTSGVRELKLRQIDSLDFDYFSRGGEEGRLRLVADLRVEYYQSGRNEGKLRRIGNVRIDYSATGRIETNDVLPDGRLIVVAN